MRQRPKTKRFYCTLQRKNEYFVILNQQSAVGRVQPRNYLYFRFLSPKSALDVRLYASRADFDDSPSGSARLPIESTLHRENLSFIGSLKKVTFAAETENEKILLHLTKKKRILRYSESAVRGWPKVNRGIIYIFVFYCRAATSRVSSEECPSPPSEQ